MFNCKNKNQALEFFQAGRLAVNLNTDHIKFQKVQWTSNIEGSIQSLFQWGMPTIPELDPLPWQFCKVAERLQPMFLSTLTPPSVFHAAPISSQACKHQHPFRWVTWCLHLFHWMEKPFCGVDFLWEKSQSIKQKERGCFWVKPPFQISPFLITTESLPIMEAAFCILDPYTHTLYALKKYTDAIQMQHRCNCIKIQILMVEL